MSENPSTRIGAAIERAIASLPEGFQLTMHMREGMGVVILFTSDGDTLPIQAHTDQLANVLDAAVTTAQWFANPIRH